MPPAAPAVKEAACVLRAIHAACPSPSALPDVTVLRHVALQLRLDLPKALKDRDAKRFEHAGVIRAHAASLFRAFPRGEDADRLGTAARLLLGGLPVRYVRPALDAWDTEAVAKVARDPYASMQALKASLDEADALASSLSFEARTVEHALWLLRGARREGHTMLPVAHVVAKVLARARQAQPDTSFKDVVDALKAGVGRGALAAVGKDGVGEPAVVRDEAFVAQHVRDRCARRPAAAPPIDVGGSGLTEQQVAAVRTLVSAPLSILTGGAGCGKTTVIRAMVDALGAAQCMLTAPTGRAARNVAGSTIHSASGGMLLRRPIQETTKADVPDAVKLLVVDEASMLTTELMIAVLNLVPPQCHIVLVGDAEQLPPVGSGNVFKDLLACGAVPVARLTYNHRSASTVQRMAHDILQGRVPEGACLVRAATDGECIRGVVRSVAQHPAAQVLTPHNASRATLNRALQSARRTVPVRCRNGTTWGLEGHVDGVLRTDGATAQSTLTFPTKAPLEMTVDDALTITAPRDPVMAGDAVMVIKNQNKKRLPRGQVSACNGDVGTFTSFLPRPVVTFGDGSTAEFPGVDGWLTLAYAATVHKFQGSECDAVVLPLVPAVMWDRQLLYTAVTRAKSTVVYVGTEAELRAIVARVRPERSSALRCLLASN